MILGSSTQEPALCIGDFPIKINHFSNILGIYINNKLSIKDLISATISVYVIIETCRLPSRYTMRKCITILACPNLLLGYFRTDAVVRVLPFESNIIIERPTFNNKEHIHMFIVSCFTRKWNLTVKVCHNFAFAVTAMYQTVMWPHY